MSDTQNRLSLLKLALDEAVRDSGARLNELLQRSGVDERSRTNLFRAVKRASRTHARRLAEKK